MRILPTVADMSAWIRTGLGLLGPMAWLRPGLRLRLRQVAIVLAFTGIAVTIHAVVLGEIVPPVSITSAHGPERVPLDRLWERSTEGWDEDETPFRRRLTLLDRLIVERGVEDDYAARLVALFDLTLLSFITALYFTLRYARSQGVLRVFSPYFFLVVVPGALVLLVIHQPDPRALYLRWSAQHPAPCADAPILPPP